IHITISNIDPNEAQNLTCELRGLENVSFERGEIITGEEVNSYNDFGEEEEVSTASFSDVEVNGNTLDVNLPAKSIVMLELK
ncbi:MAG: alpha-L-arabinofuranosidase C-terminal domain-containing protein, partial [Mariniphaga sp.]